MNQRNSVTVTFTADSIATREAIVAALEEAARERPEGGVRDIRVTSMEPAREVTVDAATYAAFQEWTRQQNETRGL